MLYKHHVFIVRMCKDQQVIPMGMTRYISPDTTLCIFYLVHELWRLPWWIWRATRLTWLPSQWARHSSLYKHTLCTGRKLDQQEGLQTCHIQYTIVKDLWEWSRFQVQSWLIKRKRYEIQSTRAHHFPIMFTCRATAPICMLQPWSHGIVGAVCIQTIRIALMRIVNIYAWYALSVRTD